MKNNSILVISNNQEIGSQIVEKIKLLRDCDTIKVVTYIESISVLNSTQPSMILLYCANSDSVGIVKEIRSLKALDKVPIIFITDIFREELLLYAFDHGIDDYFFMSDPDSIVLIRIFLTLQKTVLYKKIDMDKELLISAGIVDKQTGIYKKEQAPVVLGNFFSQTIEDNAEDTLFMYLKAITKEGLIPDLKGTGKIIKDTLRANDILAFGRNDGFYAVLENSGIKGAKSVVSRLKSKLSDICEIYAVCAQINASFEQLEPVLYEEMKTAITSENNFNYISDSEVGDMTKSLDISDENGKKFKSFQSEFFSGVEKIVTPAFVKAQGYVAERYPTLKVNFDITESESGFYIKSGRSEFEFAITYPTYTKLIIDVKQLVTKQVPVMRRAVYDVEDFSEEKLFSVLNGFIDEFASKVIAGSVKDDEEEDDE